MTDSSGSSQRAKLAFIAICLASAWVLAGASFKLFAGGPNDLPPNLVKFLMGPEESEWRLSSGFKLAIAIELCVVILALLRPKIGWLPLAGMFAAFLVVLYPLVASGAKSCGCFGGSVTIPPIAMVAIDASMLVFVLLTRPWSAFAKKPFKPMVPVFLCAVAAATPFIKADNSVSEPWVPPVQEQDPTEPFLWSLPDPLPDYALLSTGQWTGKSVYEIDLYRFLDVDTLPPDCRVVFYRTQCEHCRDHLEELAMEPPGPYPIVLIYIPEDGDTPENDVTQLKPQTDFHYELPALKNSYVVTTPVDMLVEGQVVMEVRDRETLENE